MKCCFDFVKCWKGCVEEYGKIKEAAQTESVVDYIFGTDCYSKAVRSLDKGCKLMTPDEHSTLAYLLTNCFLDHSGRRTMRCGGTNIRDCTSSMDEESFSTYQHFFINIYKWDLASVGDDRVFILAFAFFWRTTIFRSRRSIWCRSCTEAPMIFLAGWWT
mgnify:CR=1 FL=1